MSDSRTDAAHLLVIGIGNNGRADDGLGWALADRLAQLNLPNVDIEYRYQLQVEDALLVCNYPVVVFADASHEALVDGFELKPCYAATHYFFSSHMQSPETILYLAKELLNHKPEAYTLAMAGTNWELSTQLTAEAYSNLQAAFSQFCKHFMFSVNPKSLNISQ
jgi:hydrogenase maturation protease